MSSLPLPDLLLTNPNFQELPTSQQEIYLRLAHEFDDNELALLLTPSELATKLQLGTKHQWQSFLQLEPVRNYIKQQVQFSTQVASRKALATLSKQAASGDTGAAQQINKLAGALDQADENRIIILHQIKRPNKKEPTPNEN